MIYKKNAFARHFSLKLQIFLQKIFSGIAHSRSLMLNTNLMALCLMYIVAAAARFYR